MNQWRSIPKDRLVQVSYRKWMRLKSVVDWKLKRDIELERKAMQKKLDEAIHTIKNYETALDNAQNMTIKWMDKYDETFLKLKEHN